VKNVVSEGEKRDYPKFWHYLRVDVMVCGSVTSFVYLTT